MLQVLNASRIHLILKSPLVKIKIDLPNRINSFENIEEVLIIIFLVDFLLTHLCDSHIFHPHPNHLLHQDKNGP
jgi:hypothetical protein